MANGRVNEVYGLSFNYQNGRVDPLRTVLQNFAGYLPAGIDTNRRLFSQVVKAFKPDLVISDFEPFSAWWAWRNRVPCISVDHEHFLTCCRFETEGTAWKERAMAKVVVRGYHTFADAYIVLNFFKTPLVNKNAQLVPPVVRDTVLKIHPTNGEQILMYSTDCGQGLRQHIYTSSVGRATIGLSFMASTRNWKSATASSKRPPQRASSTIWHPVGRWLRRPAFHC